MYAAFGAMRKIWGTAKAIINKIRVFFGEHT